MPSAMEFRRSEAGRLQEQAAKAGATVRADELAARVHSYVLRVAGLVGVIVVVVTVGTMVVIDAMVLRPVLRLRASSVKAAASPDRAAKFIVLSSRHDEIGDLVRAHNVMLERVASRRQRDRQIAEERARLLATCDALTGQPNRAALYAYLKGLVPARAGDAIGPTLFLLNVRHFREFNATFGNEAGDELIRAIAAQIHVTAAGRYVAHLGADRFVVVELPALRADEASALAQRLISATSAPHVRDGVPWTPAVRIAISRPERDTDSMLGLLHQAELALAHGVPEGAKYGFSSPKLTREVRERQQLVANLERAIENGELQLHFQPKVSLITANARMNMVGAEILLRWQHSTRGDLGPSEFVPLAESNGHIVAMGNLVLHAACAQAASWRKRMGWTPPLAVNLFASEFSLPDLPARISSAIALSGVDASLIEIEVTESTAMRDAARATSTIASLRDAGIRVAIDDFGTGYSSLSYLRRFEVDAEAQGLLFGPAMSASAFEKRFLRATVAV